MVMKTKEKMIVKGKRLDGRKPDELRKIEMKVGVIPNAEGSAQVRFGNTVAIAGVYGPKIAHPRHLQKSDRAILKCRYNMAPFSVEDRIRPGPSRRSTEISKVIRESLLPAIFLEKYPKTKIDVYIEIINANAGTRCAAATAASVALADAGIEM